MLTGTAHAEPPRSSPLGPHETNDLFPQQTSPSDEQEQPTFPEVTFRHSGWLRHRAAIAAALDQLDVSDNRRFRFRYCGALAWVLRSKDQPDRYKIAASYCRDRFCLPCQHLRAFRLSAVLADQLPDTDLRFITLTLRHSDRPLAAQLDHLYASFRKLRRAALWRDRIPGGVAVLEVKRSKNRLRWHPHLHLIVSGQWLDKSDLSALWHRATGTSYVTDIRRVSDKAQLRRYLTKYASKPMSYATTNQPGPLAEAILALKDRRLIFCFGEWRRFKLTDDYEPAAWEPVCPLRELIERSANGEPWAGALLNHLRSKLPWDRRDKHKPSAA